MGMSLIVITDKQGLALTQLEIEAKNAKGLPFDEVIFLQIPPFCVLSAFYSFMATFQKMFSLKDKFSVLVDVGYFPLKESLILAQVSIPQSENAYKVISNKKDFFDLLFSNARIGVNKFSISVLGKVDNLGRIAAFQASRYNGTVTLGKKAIEEGTVLYVNPGTNDIFFWGRLPENGETWQLHVEGEPAVNVCTIDEFNKGRQYGKIAVMSSEIEGVLKLTGVDYPIDMNPSMRIGTIRPGVKISLKNIEK